MSMIALALHTLVAMCLIAGICTILLLCLWRGLHTLHQGTNYVKRLHQIPCSRCAYFTGDYRLKCAVHPIDALTEEAIGCVDYVSSVPAFEQPVCQGRSSYCQLKKLVSH